MTFPRARLVVSACLFLAWLGYLLYLVLLSRHTVVLSRPQFLVASLCVIGEVGDKDRQPDPEVRVVDVVWSDSPADGKLKDTKVHVANLADAGPQGYIGPGTYILALNKMGPPTVPLFVVTPVPSSPGYVPAFVNVRLYAPGPEPARAVRLAHADLGLDEADARDLVKAATVKTPVLLVRNVRRERALKFVNDLEEGSRGAKDGPEVALPANDIRIYPLTPETRAQLDELIAARDAAVAPAPRP